MPKRRDASGMNDPASTSTERARRAGSRRALVAFLFASAALHAAVIVGVPGPSGQRDAPVLPVLEVVLVQSEAARPAPVEPMRPEARAPAGAGTAARVASAEPAPRPKPIARAPAQPVLTLPDQPQAEDASVPADTPAAPPPAPAEPAPQIASLAPPTPASFSAAYLRNPAPRYPLAARRAGEEGTVTLKVLVASDGLPQRVEVEKTSGSSRLDAAALDAVKRWRFVPARRGATPIESWVLVPVVFRLENRS